MIPSCSLVWTMRNLAEHFEVNFLDEIVGYNELVEGTKEVLDYLKDKNYNIHIISNGFYDVTHRKIKRIRSDSLL